MNQGTDPPEKLPPSVTGPMRDPRKWPWRQWTGCFLMVAVGVCSTYPLVRALKWDPGDIILGGFGLMCPALAASLVGVYFFKSQKLVAFRNYLIAVTLGFLVGATALANVDLQLQEDDPEAAS